jgi:DNA-binding IscR family transcriptional regulator
LDVIEAIDGPVLMNECVSDSHFCAFKATCKMHQFWVDTKEMVVAQFKGMTLATLATTPQLFPA